MGRLVALAVLATCGVACTDGPTAPPTTTIAIELDSVPPITAPAPVDAGGVTAAEAALLTASDLPSAWTVQPNGDPLARLDAVDCAGSAIGLATAAGDDIVVPDGTVVAQSVSVGDPVVVDEVAGRIDERCVAVAAHRVAETQIAAVPGTPREVEIGDVVVERLPVPRSVAGAVAFRVTIPISIDRVDTVTFVDVVAVRTAGALAILTARHSSTPPAVTDLDRLARAVAARLGAIDHAAD